MAKRKSSRFNLHKIVTMAVIVLGVVGIGFTVYANQQRTNTESDAAVCRYKPNLKLVSTDSYKNKVIYRLNILNVNSKSCKKKVKYKLRVINKPNKNWKFDFAPAAKDFGSYTVNRCREGILLYQEVDKWKLRITPSSSARKGTYYFKVQACAARNAALSGDIACFYTSDYSKCATRSLKYIKD